MLVLKLLNSSPLTTTVILLLCLHDSCNGFSSLPLSSASSSLSLSSADSPVDLNPGNSLREDSNQNETNILTTQKPPSLRKKLVHRVKKLLGRPHKSLVESDFNEQNQDQKVSKQNQTNETNAPENNGTISRRQKLASKISKTLRATKVASVNQLTLARSGSSGFHVDWGQVKERLCFWCDLRGSGEEDDGGEDFQDDELSLQMPQNETLSSSAKILAASNRKPGGGSNRKSSRLPHQNTTQLLLFTKAGNGSRFEARVSKYTKLSDLSKIGFNPEVKTVLLIHGFRGSTIEKQLWCIKIKDMILEREKANVFYVDWHHHARVWNYYHALNHVPEIAQDIYEILLNLSRLSQQHQQSPTNATATSKATTTTTTTSTSDFLFGKTHAIGHSLGAHVAGLLGQLANGKLRKITALDPAGFALESRANHEKLSSDDARAVVAYHTDKYLGYARRVAQQDIYVNGGSVQPACKLAAPPISTAVSASGQPNASTSLVDRMRVSLSIAATCNHRIVRDYMSTFMGKCIMMAYLCPSYEQFESGQCGFCAYNSSSCLVFGLEWQYEPQSMGGSSRDNGKSASGNGNKDGSGAGSKGILAMAGDFVGKLTSGFGRSSRREQYGQNNGNDTQDLDATTTSDDLNKDIKFTDKKQESTFLDYPYQKYYVKTGAARPYCLFIYQVVVRFGLNETLASTSDSSSMLKSNSSSVKGTRSWGKIEARQLVYSMSSMLSKTQTIETSSLSELNKLDSGKKIDVYDSKGQLKTLQGGQIFTGLNSCDKIGCSYYDLMPVRFQQFNLKLLPVGNTSTKPPLASGTKQQESESRTADDLKDDDDDEDYDRDLENNELRGEQVEVYVNFMSHYDFNERAKFSGPMKVNGG